MSKTTFVSCWILLSGLAAPALQAQTLNITSAPYNATTGSADNAAAIQAAINAVGSGGTVLVPSGTFLSGPLTLKSNMTFQLASGATLKMLAFGTFPQNTDFIYSTSVTNTTINGSGILDGQGAAWWTDFNNGNPDNRPPAMVYFSKSSNVTIMGITVKDSPKFHVQTLGAMNGVYIGGVSITAAWPSPNTDGIDLRGKNYLIENSYISDGDDVIQIGGSSDNCQAITIRNCTFGTGHGLSIGGYTQGGVSNLLVDRCTFNGTQYGIRWKTGRDRGGVITNLTYSNITMTNILLYPFFLTSWYPNPSSLPPTSDTAAATTSTTPYWSNIVLRNITASTATSGAKSPGIMWAVPEAPVSNVLMDGVTTTGPSGVTFEFHHARGVTILCNCRVDGQQPPTNVGAFDATISYPACGSATNTFTFTPTKTNTPVPPTNTFTATSTKTNTPMPPTATLTNSATFTPTSTRTNTPVPPTNTFTSTATASSTPTKTNTPVPPTNTFTSTFTHTASSTATPTKTNTPIPPTGTFTSTPTPTSTSTDTSTRTNTPVPPTATFTNTNSPVPPSMTPTNTNSPVPPSATPTKTFTVTSTNTPTHTLVPPTATPTNTNSPVPPSPTPASSMSATPTLTASLTFTATSTDTPTKTAVPPSATPTLTDTPVPPTATSTSIPSATNTPVAPTSTATNTNSPVPPSATPTSTFTTTSTNSPIPPSATPTRTFTATVTNTMTSTAVPPTATLSWTLTATSSMSATPTLTASRTFTATFTATPSSTSTATSTLSLTVSATPTASVGIQGVIYPNPVSGNTFTLQVTGMTTTDKVQVQVETAAFRIVNQLTFHSEGPGTVNLTMPTTDATGVPLANGVYYVIVRTEGARLILKLLVMK